MYTAHIAFAACFQVNRFKPPVRNSIQLQSFRFWRSCKSQSRYFSHLFKELYNFGFRFIRILCHYLFIGYSAILKSWCGNNGFVRTINQKMIGTYLLSEMTIILTRYGTQGSYKVPNSVVVNISNVPNEYIIKTVIHESFHLMTECLIKKYSVEHWVKERIVDLIIDFEYKSRFKMQSVPDWVLATDVIFRKYYPNIVLITRKASKIKATAHSTENMQGPSGQID